MAGRLDGKTALITGGASGIGAASCRLFAREGARVIIADIQDDLGESLSSEIGDAAIFQHTDVRKEQQIADAVDRGVAEFGKLDCMFANAGIVGTVGPIDELPIDEWDFTMSINLRGVILCMKHAARVMKPQKSGSILSTSSIAALSGGLGPHAYAASKAALKGITQNIAAELAQYGIRVNCIAPGNLATEMVSGLVFEDPNHIDDIAVSLAESSPLPGRAGRAEDIAQAALYLASDDSGYVAGHTLVVDAGLTSGSGGTGVLFENYSPMVREAGKRGMPEE